MQSHRRRPKTLVVKQNVSFDILGILIYFSYTMSLRVIYKKYD